MRILNEEDVEIQEEDVDYKLGHLVEEKIFKEHHEAVEATEKVFHYYPTVYYMTDGTQYQTTLGAFRAKEREELDERAKTEPEAPQPTNLVSEYEQDPRVVVEDDGITFGYKMDDGEIEYCGGDVVRGIDVDEVVDKEATEAKEAWDEYEDIKRYVLYTQEELDKRAKEEVEQNLASLKRQQLSAAVSLLMPQTIMSLPDEEVSSVSAFIEDWIEGQEYLNGSVVRYQNGLWRAITNVTDNGTAFTPDAYVAGWKRIGEPNEDGIYPYEQPLGATDCYMIGDKVTFNDKVYESVIDNNVWSPDAYPRGWKCLTEEEVVEPEQPEEGGEEESPSEESYPEFVQPTGGHDAYNMGDKVTYNGKHYESTIDSNVWSPDAYPAGWKEI